MIACWIIAHRVRSHSEKTTLINAMLFNKEDHSSDKDDSYVQSNHTKQTKNNILTNNRVRHRSVPNENKGFDFDIHQNTRVKKNSITKRKKSALVKSAASSNIKDRQEKFSTKCRKNFDRVSGFVRSSFVALFGMSLIKFAQTVRNYIKLFIEFIQDVLSLLKLNASLGVMVVLYFSGLSRIDLLRAVFMAIFMIFLLRSDLRLFKFNGCN